MSGLRVLVCGGRDNWDQALVWGELSRLHERQPIATIVHGDAPGVDTIAGNWAHSAGVECWAYPANWRKNGRAAGPIRNQRMLAEAKPDIVIAFPGGKGTADMVRRARAAGIEVREILPSHDREADHER